MKISDKIANEILILSI